MRLLSTTEAVAAVRGALAGRSGTRWIGVDGFGASGKSTLARLLAAALPEAVVVSTDDFSRAGTPTWEQDRFAAQVLEPLLAGRPGRYQRWPYHSDVGLEWVDVSVGVPVVVEGVSATDIRVPVPWDLTIWVETPVDLRWRRILRRDPSARLTRWRAEWLPREEVYAASQAPQERADLLVDGSGPAT